ncbi:sigma-70 family RNA polymerase sigma factor [Aquiluna sp.]|nr:sigma-70 family RNA polymerase sigma factor [Aquiluna sp.]
MSEIDDLRSAMGPTEEGVNAEAFGTTVWQECVADSGTRAVLSDWTAQDFANIYVRFLPHLESHARRYLDNPTHVEEVVQDAFLYLMTSLPELDSELGVLKFLKWKVKMLSIDVVRLSHGKSVVALDTSHENSLASEEEISESIERAEDAAVVSLALSKLNPRHREVIVRSVYEEKSASELASELGLSENATRQLLLRAKRSFRVALVGETDVKGMNLTEILSLAARKSKQAAIRVSAFILVVGVSAGIYSQFDLPSAQPGADQVVSSPTRDEETNLTPLPAPGFESRVADATQGVDDTIFAELTPMAGEPVSVNEELIQPEPEPEAEPATDTTAIPTNGVDAANLREIETLSAAWFGTATSNQPEVAIDHESAAGELQVHSSSGFSAFVGLDPAAASQVNYLYLRLSVGEYILTAVPQRILVRHEDLPEGGTRIFIGAADLIVGDLDGALGNLSYDASTQLRLGIQIEFDMFVMGSISENVSMELLELGQS